ncbi:MAG: sulfatase-like hydrolase/transferase [Candidatus Cryptobacteroides sp.]
MRNKFAALPAALTLASALTAPAIEKDNGNNRKNVLFLVVDDMKPVLGCYGDNIAKTPNIDRLSEEGIVFNHAYCQQAVSGASRCSMLTGLRPDHLGIYGMDPMRNTDRNPVTMPEYFRIQGYETIAIGKIFDQRTVDSGHDTLSWSVPFLSPSPSDYYEGRMPSGGFRSPDIAEAVRKGYAEAKRMGLKGADANRYVKIHSQNTTECVDLPDNAYNDGVFADKAVKEIDRLAETERPFFLAVGFHKPHLPFIAPEKYWNMYDRDKIPVAEFTSAPDNYVPEAYSPYKEILDWKDMQDAGKYLDETGDILSLPVEKQKELIHGYYACVSYVDAQIGKVLDALKRNGLDSNTVIVLLGDHGWHLGDHGIWAKATNFEQAARIPLIISIPGKSGTVSDNIVEMVDIFPTLCAFAGIPKPQHLPGKAIGEATGSDPDPEAVAVSQYPRPGNIMGYSIRDNRYRFTLWLKKTIAEDSVITDDRIAGEELYDYLEDPLETRNIAAEESCRDIRDRMFCKFQDYISRQADGYRLKNGWEINRYFDGTPDVRSAAIMRSAADSIEKYRKGDFSIKVIDAKTGKPVRVPVRLNLAKHKFNFGVSMYGVSALQDSVLKRKAEDAIRTLFNTVTVCDYFKKNALYGDPMPSSACDDIKFACANDKTMRFHAALFNIPQWINGAGYTEERCWDMIERRLKYISENYAGIIDEYDIINEFINEFHYPGRAFYDNNPEYPQFRNPETAKKVMALARKYLPEKKLVVLETSVASANNPIFREIVDFYKALVEAGGDFDYVGYQGHFYGHGDFRKGDRELGPDTFKMSSISDALDMLGDIGKPVIITEFNGPSRHIQRGGREDKEWTLSDEENADWQINFYRLAFSKPYIHQITRWFLIDELGGAGIDAGILCKDGGKKAIYDKLNHLLNVEWHTDVTLPLLDGNASFRGFYGKYDVEAKGYGKGSVVLNEDGEYIISLTKK